MNLRTYRKQNRITLTAFGAKLGVSGVTVHRWETGKVRPSLDAVEAIERETDGHVGAADFMRQAPSRPPQVDPSVADSVEFANDQAALRGEVCPATPLRHRGPVAA